MQALQHCAFAGTQLLRPSQRQQRAHPQRRATSLVPRALGANELLQIAEAAAKAAPGSVDAPPLAIVGGAVVVTALSLLLTLGLKPGTDAAIEMQSRDKKKFNKRD